MSVPSAEDGSSRSCLRGAGQSQGAGRNLKARTSWGVVSHSCGHPPNREERVRNNPKVQDLRQAQSPVHGQGLQDGRLRQESQHDLGHRKSTHAGLEPAGGILHTTAHHIQLREKKQSDGQPLPNLDRTETRTQAPSDTSGVCPALAVTVQAWKPPVGLQTHEEGGCPTSHL